MKTFKKYIYDFNIKKKKKREKKDNKWFVPSNIDDSSVLSAQANMSVSNLGSY